MRKGKKERGICTFERVFIREGLFFIPNVMVEDDVSENFPMEKKRRSSLPKIL